MNPLSPKRRSELRAQAHKLSPVVIIGDKGLTDEVVAEVDRSLKAHELIKVRAASDDRDARATWFEALCGKLAAHPVQQIGKVFVLFRENPKEEPARRPRVPVDAGRREKAPEAAKKPAGRKPPPRARAVEARSPTGTSRPRSRTPSPPRESAPPRRRPRTSR